MVNKPVSRSVPILAALVIVAAILALIGWQFDIATLKSISTGVTPMNPVTAVTFLLSGLWLLKNLFRQYSFFRITGAIIAYLVAFVGAVHFLTYIFPFPALRFDNLLYNEKIRNSHIQNLIAPNTALVFLLSGSSMLLTHIRKRNYQLIRQGLIFVAFCIVYVSLVGYIFQITFAYRFAQFTPMALSTAIVFTLLNLGLFLCNTEHGMARTFTTQLRGGQLLRRITPFLLLVPMVIGYLRLVGERQGLYPSEFGVGIYTFLFAISVFIFVYMYAVAENRQHLVRLKSQLQLANSEHKFRTLYHTLTEGVLGIDERNTMQFCNTGFSKMTGYDEAELKNKSILPLFIAETENDGFYEMLAARPVKPGAYQPQIIRKDGQPIWVNLKITPLHLRKDDTVVYLVTIVDVTQERLNHEDLKAFTASAAHDLNSPLARIIMALDVFETGNLDEDQRMLIDAIAETAADMRQLLADLLAYSRLGVGPLDKTLVDMDKLVREICSVETNNSFRGKLQVHPLPADMVNEPSVRQLFTNLVSNAIKYSSHTPAPEVEIGIVQPEKEVTYYVRDNGAGMTPDNLKNLFKPFKRFHAEFEGNGMGLAIVKRVIEKHGGKIWVESAKGQGTTFYFTLHNRADHL